MHCTSCALKRKVGKPLLFKQTLRSRFTCPACRHFSFHAKKSLDRKRPFSLGLRVVSLLSCLSRLAPLVTRVVFAVSGVLLDGLRKKRDCSQLDYEQSPIFPQGQQSLRNASARENHPTREKATRKKSYLTPLKNLNYDILLPIRESFYTVRLRREHSLALHNPENFNVGSKSRLDAIFFRPL